MQANQKIQILLLSALLTAGTIQASETISTLLTHGTNLVNWSIQKGSDAFNFVWPKAQKYGQEFAQQASSVGSQLAKTGKQNASKWTLVELHKSVDSPLLQETGNQFVDGAIPSLRGAWSQEKLMTHVSNLPKKIGTITQAFAPQALTDCSEHMQTINTDYCPEAAKYALIISGTLVTAYIIHCNKEAIAAKWAQLRKSSADKQKDPEANEEITPEE